MIKKPNHNRSPLQRVLFSILLLAISGAASAKELDAIRPVMNCDQLVGNIYDIEGSPARITAASAQPAGTPYYCLVEGYVAPQVHFELRLPLAQWKQRLLFTGCGGFCGRVRTRVQAADNCASIENNEMAIVTSDLGHSGAGGSDGLWAVGNANGIRDFGSRGVHVSTVIAKKVIEDFYGAPSQYHYFSGCSDGGREGVMAAQRYPEDFDGVIVGAPVVNVTANNSIYHAWIVQNLMDSEGNNYFEDSTLEALTSFAVQSCDSLDGKDDGLISDPQSCKPSFEKLLCPDNGSNDCLTEKQLIHAQNLYDGPKNERGEQLYFGLPVGSEYTWNNQASGSLRYGTNFISYMTGRNVSGEVDVQGVTYERADLKVFNRYADELNALNKSLRPFADRGGKLIVWHGWADTGAPPGSSIHLYDDLLENLGDELTQNFARLYMLPAVRHCGGGDGPNTLDLLTKSIHWVEDSNAPDEIVAYNADNPSRSWRVFPYPQQPEYED